jgi:hypothetical protein
MLTEAPFPHCVIAPTPTRATRHLLAARFFLTSGALWTDPFGIYFQPDGFWSRTFGADEGWYVAEWPDIGAIELRQGARYSLRRSRIRVFDTDGQIRFRAEVTSRAARAMLGATELLEVPAPGVLDNRRYVRRVLAPVA